MSEHVNNHPLPLRLMALCAVAVLSVSACRDGDDQAAEQPSEASAPEEGAAEPTAPEDDADPAQSGPLEGREDLFEYGVTYRVPDGWELVPALPAHRTLEMDQVEVAHAMTRLDGTYVAFVSLTAVESVMSDGRIVTTSDAATTIRTFIGPLNEGFRDDGQEPYTVPGAEEATRIDIAFAELEVTQLVVDTGAEEFAVLSVGIDQDAQPTPDEVPEGITDDILASVSVG